jgi:hypothetical protein
MTRLWRRLPCILALALLTYQASVPWIAGDYITQDGPSHLYNALVFKDLILHPHGFYSSVYRLQPRLVTNWGTVLLLGVLAPVVGPVHAEQCLATILVVAGFFCISYFRRSVTPSRAAVYDPLTNFLLNSWFFWIGFYNFYLGAAICLLLVGFYIRHIWSFTARTAAILAAGVIGLFFVHVMPATLAIMTIVVAAVWVRVVIPFWQRNREQRSQAPRTLGLLMAALTPTLILLFFFVRHAVARIPYALGIREAWNAFPMHAFASARGRAGEETLLVPAMLFYALIGILAMKRSEWFTVRPALGIAALVSFAGYLFVPNEGFGGAEIKIRLAWATFAFGCVLAASVAKLRPLRTVLSVYITCFLVASLATTTHNARNIGRATEVYAAAFEKIPTGENVVRLRYGTEGARKQFGFDDVAMEPLFHADAWMASRRHYIDLTDAWALDRLYPVCYRKNVSGEQQNWLYEMEDGETNGFGPLVHIWNTLPVRFNYVVLVGDAGSEATRNSDFLKAAEWLGGNMQQLATEPENSFVRVYRRVHLL